MQILKVIARLLDYPTQDLLDNADILVEATASTKYLPPELRQQIIALIERHKASDIYDLQADYDSLFERGRYVSLLIFEHVHGESRDRGQAMVDLLDMYKSKGFELDSRQMPDYTPLFLEFLSEQDEMYAREWLADVGHILALLEERLNKRDSDFSSLFSSLLVISGAQVDRQEIQKTVQKEAAEDTLEAIDKEWEDKEIRFDDPIDGQSCPSNRPDPALAANKNVPIQWHDAADASKAKSLQR
ncbi:MAG: nitrate reductase molybdenum cofactor assembly chaperone [Kangiellaceae bacterium]|nr:nitrate reductase molybdenum cofactor assembly chaperone [Kangiellaceae bacterium]